jgi:putative Flp pilus-assembly TadE/G-like protein
MRRVRSRGFGLLLTLFGMGFLVLTLGTGIDISHIYLVQNELQSAIDEIALSAARELDGTGRGLERARNVAQWGRAAPDREDWFAFSTDHLTALQAEFALIPEGPWSAAPRDAENFRFVRVSATADARLFFLPMLPAGKTNQQIAVLSTAGQQRAERTGRTDAAYLTPAVDPDLPDFGFTLDQTQPLSLQRQGKCPEILEARFRLDSDTTSSTYEEYGHFGNGQRVVFAAVTDRDAEPVGYATLLVMPDILGSGRCEAAYAGNAPVRNAARNGAGEPGLYEVRLYQ